MKKIVLILVLMSCVGSLQAQERFTTQETVVVTKPKPSSSSSSSSSASSGPVVSGRAVKLRVGEVVEVFVFRDKFGTPREAFFIPLEGTRVAQVVKERAGNTDRFYLKGRAKGKTAGGIVLRDWLDSKGFKPKSIGDEVRIQAAVKANPVYITVE